jgi:adenylate kinase
MQGPKGAGVTASGRGARAPGRERPILVLLGPVAAGKGTQATILADRLGIVHLASGNLFRAALAEGTELGERARPYMDRGELVPDEITIDMFMAELAKPAAAKGAVLDGFPRTVGQARALDGVLADAGERISRVLFLEVPDDDVVRRVAGRRVCPVDGSTYHVEMDPPRTPGRCDRDGAELVLREDDRPEVVRARLEKQIPPMLEVVAHYDSAGIVERIDGTQPIEAVTAQVLGRLARASSEAAR